MYKTTDFNVYSFNVFACFLGNPVAIYSSEIDSESPKTKLGDACETSDECVTTTNHTECYGNICVCELGYSNFAGVCKPGKFYFDSGKLFIFF